MGLPGCPSRLVFLRRSTVPGYCVTDDDAAAIFKGVGGWALFSARNICRLLHSYLLLTCAASPCALGWYSLPLSTARLPASQPLALDEQAWRLACQTLLAWNGNGRAR